MQFLSKIVVAIVCVLMVTALQAGVALAASAEGDLTVAIKPYAWLTNVEGDITADGVTGHIDSKFSDMIEHVDIAASFFVDAAYQDKWVLLTQLDYFKTSEAFNRTGSSGEVTSKMFLFSAGAGRRFHGVLLERVTADVLVGVRYLNMGNEIQINDLGTTKDSTGILDANLTARFTIPFCEKWRFVSMLSIGTGESDFVYEIQPHLEYSISERWSALLGYRRLGYDYDGNRDGFDGTLHGILVGGGVRF